MIQKIVLIFVSVAGAVVIASAYGAMHNLITYQISPEYFTLFKFIQFGMSKTMMPELIKAMYVGVLASWWMGLFIGGVVGCELLFAQRQFRALYYGIATMLVLTCAILGAMIFDHLVIDHTFYFLPPGVTDAASFYLVGSIHNGSYAGGFIGTIIAILMLPILIFRSRKKADV